MTARDYMAGVGEWLLSERAALGISQEEVAKLLGVSVSSIGNWESAKATIGAPSLARLKAFFKERRKAKGIAEVSA